MIKIRAKHPKSHPLRGAKKRIQGCSSATADFLLEAERARHSPKSEKAAAFWRVGERGGGAALFAKGKNVKDLVDFMVGLSILKKIFKL